MRDILWIVVIVFTAIDGFLNLNGKPNLGQVLFAGASESARRVGISALYLCILVILVYLGWFAQ